MNNKERSTINLTKATIQDLKRVTAELFPVTGKLTVEATVRYLLDEYLKHKDVF